MVKNFVRTVLARRAPGRELTINTHIAAAHDQTATVWIQCADADIGTVTVM